MANRLYNKQVSPKGYQKGGSVKKDYKLGLKFQGDYKGKSVPGKIKEFFKTGAKQTAGTAKKIAKQKVREAKKIVGAPIKLGKKISKKFRTKKMEGGKVNGK